MMKANLRSFIESSWYEGKGAFLPLLPFSWLFGLLSGLRRWLYGTGLLRSPELPLPVVVVGNINVGGTGKTPIVAWLADQLTACGHRPGIVSRGYGGAPGRQPRLVLGSDAAEYGDEPVLLSALTGCPVCVSPDRVAAVRRISQEGVTIVISDDGLQHYRMRRVMEIVVVDAERGFGNGHLLPAGPLRESVSRAHAADAIVINGQSGHMAGFRFQLERQEAVNLVSGDQQPLDAFSGQRVWAVAGIGNPGRFYLQLRAAGLLVDEVPVADHGSVAIEQLLTRKNQTVFMTEKDAVKYKGENLLNVWYLPVVAVCSDQDAEELLKILRSKLAAEPSNSSATI